MEDEILSLTDLIDIDVLQQLQDAFSGITGIAALTTDNQGVAVTKGSNFSEFCFEYTRKSAAGCERCEKCDRRGAQMALEQGKSVTYYCHAGLVDFAAPIMAGCHLVGCFIGGQVLPEPPVESEMRRVAEEIGVDPDKYLAAAGKVRVMPKAEIDKAAGFLYIIANILSNMAYNKYCTFQANIEIEKVANMKSDFLANMSHEIRTPMNAVIGMAEMALREDLTPAARMYINQIKSSGRSLLAIINDILDFSKIESGKMDINAVEYEPMSIVNNISNVVMTRIGDKDVEFIMDVSPNIPHKLFGDNIRIEQIVVNLANNAVKFTSKGQVVLKMGYERISEDEVALQISVKDTGIGIKQQDMGKLFESFQQLDSKRNRNIEGTGLGLAISKQLLTLMNGGIWVESEYGKGSCFSCRIPQKIVEDIPSISLKSETPVIVAGLISSPYVKQQLQQDIMRFGAVYTDVAVDEEVEKILEQDVQFLFVEETQFTSYIEFFVKNNPQITCVVLEDFHSAVHYDINNLRVVKKPLYALNLAAILNREDMYMSGVNSGSEDFTFIAPEAHILIVDDNAINLTVAEGLLKPLEMDVDGALSGKEAIEKISEKKYDLIFMDHMMPELDGVETTHIIRRFHSEYEDVPIIALTANAIAGVKEMFIQEGMNDFVAKPIEPKLLVLKVKQWLSPKKIQRVQYKESKQEESKLPQIADLNTAAALKLLGTEELFWNVLEDYYRVIQKKAERIQALQQQKDWQDYTIEVHALKSASKQIGAMELSEKAEKLEMAGNILRDQTEGASKSEQENAESRMAAEDFIAQNTEPLLAQYLYYQSVLAPYFEKTEESDADKQMISPAILIPLLARMREASDNLDMDEMERVMQELGQYQYDANEQQFLEQLKIAAAEMDVDACITIADGWEQQL